MSASAEDIIYMAKEIQKLAAIVDKLTERLLILERVVMEMKHG